MTLDEKIKKCKPGQKRYWFHCASVGEFEQGRPLLEAIKKQDPTAFIILSFFSPSGYELHRNYSEADLVTYLPADSRRNAERWFNILKPDQVFFIKYEFWYYLLCEAYRRKTPLYLVSAHFRKKQLFFSRFGKLHREMLRFFSYIFIQDYSSEILLKSIGIDKVMLSGDTRIDRVLDIKAKQKVLPFINNFKKHYKILVCGSSWSDDEKLMLKFWEKYLKNKDWKLIIAPHEIRQKKIIELKSKFEKTAPTLLYSEISETTTLENVRVLIIDNIGMLSNIYAYANAAFIGGGFGKGIHNSLEAAVFGIPVFFGPNNHKFIEAQSLKNIGQAIEVTTAETMTEKFEQLNFDHIKKQSFHYFEQESSVSQKILTKIYSI